MAVLNNNHDPPSLFVENNKNHLILKKHQKIINFWASESLCEWLGNHGQLVVGKRRDGLLVKRGKGCRMVQRLRPEMLSDVAKIKGGNRDTSPAPGVMWWGNLAYQVEGKATP